MTWKWMVRLVRLMLAVAALFAVYAAVLCLPQPFFAYIVRHGNLALYSDRALPEASARNVLRIVDGKLARSPLYVSRPKVAAFICNSPWREHLFFNTNYGVGGVAYPFSTKVFLREAAVDENRLISPHGIPVTGVRTLDFFVTHEMVHALTGHAIGSVRYSRLPQWIREGYPDYVAWGPRFNYNEARRAFLSGAVDMDYRRTGLYWRFAFLVAHLLDEKHWSVDRLLAEPFPDQQVLEGEIRDAM